MEKKKLRPRLLQRTSPVNDSASGKNGDDADRLTQEQAADVWAATNAAQGLETPAATSEAQPGDQGGGGAGGGPTAPPVPPPVTISGGKLAACLVDGVLARYFGPAGPLLPEEHEQAVALWNQAMMQLGAYIPTIGPGGQLFMLYGVHLTTLYAVRLMTPEPPCPTKPENTSSPDSPAVERPRS